MPSSSIEARFLTAVARDPTALALATGALRLTYGELAAAAAALAGRIAPRQEDASAIALVLPHGAPLAIGMLAVQRVQRAAVPIDPQLPAPRRAALLADAGAGLVVGTSGDDGGFAVAPGAADARAVVGHPRIAADDRPALLLYTSGSTGVPHGVVYSERTLLARIVDADRFALGPGDRVGIFGAAGMHLFRTLLGGAALCSWDVAHDGLAGVADWIGRERLTVLQCLPTLFRRLTAAWGTRGAWPHLRAVSLTGEPVCRADLASFRRCFPATTRLLNGLGTSETGTFCQATFAAAAGPDEAADAGGDVVPVGHAVEGCTITLRGDDGGPVPPGAVGEIVVGGPLLAAGYWRHPELDALRFGADGYRTGDLGRLLPDGSLVHLGRRDQQVKVRGVRVEPAEVEAALRAHPDVRDAAVRGLEDVPGEARLVACVATAERTSETAAALARFLRARLPDAMVPDGWSLVDALPLLPGGKVDRGALPLPPPRRPPRPAAGIVALFAARAAADGDAVAYRMGDDVVTYAELDRRSAALAARLVAAGVGREAVVAIALERGPAYATALLAVLRAGGACLPLDPHGPPARAEHVLRASGTRWLVTTPACGLGRDAALARFDVDGAAVAPPVEPLATPRTPLDPDRLAFVLYTSGSTGEPKGVEVGEGQVLHRLAWDWSARPYAPGEVACQRAAVGFVDAIAEWLGALLCGVATVILSDDELQHPRDLVATLAATAVTRILLVPSQLALLLDVVPDLGRRVPALTLWTASGEPLPPALVARFHAACPHATLWNVYGATEAWDATAQRLAGTETVVPIGTPLPGMRTYLLDDALAPVPRGVAGDLYLAGAGLARGYRADAARTRERFVENPFSPGTGDRLYRTGDRARLCDDGTLEHLGRSDRCVKLRGVRIELGEIEAVLARHADVREAAVVLRDDRLVAFAAPEPGRTLDGATLRLHLREHLPVAAVPGRIVTVATLPRNDRGKLARAELAEPPHVVVPPATELEETLIQVFADLLGRTPIGADDDFFDRGGDSLLAVQLVAEIEALTGLRAPLDAVAAAPTPRGIAAVLGASGFGWERSSCITVHPNGAAPPLFAICGAWGYAIRLLRVARALGEDVPVHALQPPGMRWDAGLDLPAMAAHYVRTIRDRVPHGPYRILGTSFGGIVAFEVALQLRARCDEVALLAMVDSAAPGSELRTPPPPVVTHELEVASRAVYLAHQRALASYRPRARFDGRIVYFRCATSAPRAVDRIWATHAEDVAVVDVPGEHGFFHVQPQLGAIVARLDELLRNPHPAPRARPRRTRPLGARLATVLRDAYERLSPRRPA